MKLPKEYIFTEPIKRGNKTASAKFVQEWLTLNGINVVIDKDFGGATELAVKKFQERNGLQKTGIVDNNTFNKLISPIYRATASVSVQVKGKTFGEAVMTVAKQHLKEHPIEVGKPNCGPWVRLYTQGNEGAEWFWCAGFVSYIYAQAAESLGVESPLHYTLSCDNLASQATAKGLFVSEKHAVANKQEIAPGGIFLIRRSVGDWEHTGIVENFVNDKDGFDSIEGNTNDDGSRDGYEVCERVRGYIGKDFIRLL
ncbi:MAG: peptidoglycan-binding protein [Ignavibacteriae bacterium]|nr:peptidoglycan-binding protein [Ignavibacteriota bacterium]